MGGGGSIEDQHIDPRKPKEEKGTIDNWYQFQQDQLNKYLGNNPLLGAANAGSLSNYNQLGNLTNPLQQLLGQTPGQYGQLQSGLGGLFHELNQFGGQLGRLGQKTAGLEGPLNAAYRNQINPVLQSGGALTPALLRDAQQQQLGLEAGAGTAHTTPGIERTVLNSEEERQKRFANYLGMGQSTAGTLAGLIGQEAGIKGQQAGIAGQQGGILGMKGSLLGQQASTTQGLASGIQGLQTGGLNQLLGTQGANVSTFTGLQNPILGYLGNLFGQNLQARTAEAQINAQAQQANASASAGKAGGAMSSVGSIIGAVLPLLAMSDERMKQKIRDTGMTSKEGVPIKTFEYKTRPGVVMLGVLSKDVKAKVPSAVTRDAMSGVEFVDTKQFPIFELSATRKAA